MGGRKRGNPFHRPRKPKQAFRQGSSKKPAKHYVLEEGSLASFQAEKQQTKNLLEYYWKFYTELAFQRSKHQEAILSSLREGCTADFKFDRWQRAVKYKYSLHPLSTLGSLTFLGGRFNIGDINPNVPSFPALYVGCDKETALQEALGQSDTGSTEINALERALTNPQSELLVSVSGKIERVFDLRRTDQLTAFMKIIESFSLSDSLLEMADAVGEGRPMIIQDPKILAESLLDPDWRIIPARYDVPSNPQIFGHLLYLAGIEAVVYPSKFTGKDCLAIFPHHFENSNSFIQIDDVAPHPNVPVRVDSSNWRVCDLSQDEVINTPKH